MKKATTVLRFLFAIFYIYSALGYFFGFMPLPKMEGMAKQLIDAMVASGYLMFFVKLTELVGGVLLLFNSSGLLGLAVLAPITLNILLFNLVLNPALMGLGIIMFVIHLALVWNYRQKFMAVLRKEPVDAKQGHKVTA